jgi:RNA polymerase sigma-70 factor (ECF subfamily)
MATGRAFPDTHWSVVMLAADGGEPEARGALELLFRSYWYPLFACLRSQGHAKAEAEDHLQGFFVHLVERRTLGRADRLKGSFRGFLLGCLRFYLANQRELAVAQKRGGKAQTISLDFDAAEAQLQHEGMGPAEHVEMDFDRRWARLLLERALETLQARYVERPLVFAALKDFLTKTGEARYSEIAALLGTSEGTVKVTVHRMRAQFRELLRAEIAATVSAPHEIEAELRHLANVLVSE